MTNPSFQGVDVGERLQLLLLDLQDVRGELARSGEALPAAYVEGAVDALRAALRGNSVAGFRTNSDTAFIGRHRIRFLPTTPDTFKLDVDAATLAHRVDDASDHIGAAIGSDEGFMGMLRCDDLAAATLYLTLAHCDWINLATGDVFHGTASAAEGIVGTLSGRSSYPRWRMPKAGRVHQETQTRLGMLGWKRLRGVQPPGPH